MGPYARQGKLIARTGQRDALAEALLSGSNAATMQGCQLYLVGLPDDDADAILITEVWDSEASHRNSLSLPGVREAIARAMPFIDRLEGQAMTLIAGWPVR